MKRKVTSIAVVAVVSLCGAVSDAYACHWKLGDRVWHDRNANGIQDSDEAGINGVRIIIDPPYYDPTVGHDVNSVVTAQLAPGMDGYYLFQPLKCGPHTITVDFSTVPAGLSPTLIRVGDEAFDSDDPSGTVVDLPALIIDENLTIDFGFVAPACAGALGNRVWNDANANGIQDAGEGNYANAVVNLTGPTGSGAVTANGSGEYIFGGLCAGTYKICVPPPAGTIVSPANQGADDTADSDGVVGSDGVCTTVTLPSFSTVDLSNDFGFYEQPSQVGTGTPGYWKSHSETWPVASIVIGGRTYSEAEAIALMDGGAGGDKSYTMFMHLVSTKLNLASGTEAGCIAGTVGLVDAWMAAYPVGSQVKGSSLAWKNGEPLATQLDRYNNGMLCAPHRD